MDSAHLVGTGKVGNRPRHTQDAVEATRRKPHRGSGVGEQLAAWIVRRRHTVQRLAVGFGVRAGSVAVVAIGLNLPSRCDTCGDIGASFRRWRQRQVGGCDGRYFDVQVYTIEQGPGYPRLVTRGASWCATAGKRRISKVPAPARVHGGDQLNPRGKGYVGVRSSHAHVARLERLPQRIQDGPLKLRKLVEEQDAEMGEADLAGPDAQSSADQSRHGRAMVGRPERPPAPDLSAIELARNRRDHRDFERFAGL
jgi:hypothetical protein